MTSREAHVAADARGDGDAKAGAGATVSGEETPAAPQRAAREKRDECRADGVDPDSLN